MLANWSKAKEKKLVPDEKHNFQPNQTELDRYRTEFYERETDLKKLCYDYLLTLPMCHPIDTPNFPMKRHPVKQKGIGDLHFCFMSYFLAIETKVGKNGQSPEQKDYQIDIESSRGIYLLIYKFDDLVKQIASIKRKIKKKDKIITNHKKLAIKILTEIHESIKNNDLFEIAIDKVETLLNSYKNVENTENCPTEMTNLKAYHT